MAAYWKRLYVFDGDRPVEAIVRPYTEADFADLIRIQQASFPPPFPSELWWNERQLREHVTRFPIGALCVTIGDRPVGSITGLRVSYDPHADEAHTWEAVTDGGYIRTHRPDGDTLYIVDICVLPECRKLGLGKLLMQSMYEVVVQLGLVRLLGGGRMPGYGRVADRKSPEAYVQDVLNGEERDPVLTFLLRCGRTPVALAPHYLDDEESGNYALLMEWRNPFLAAAQR
ncbi:GNAT family N-acetyltransferase [Paenibacillus athensensis]|uniref:GNAT family N-acetyltransferase n=1 Tax=Paenibacillus athensensis TaxID=1967502 RepID=A0A4Y8Q9W8_9BACL|nr:GNAT family N-acetyltransferase [Paenibacillus athensensis]MCD1260044.1 GNAT family N-acetyltransferase [Paenibacillus athensensis]